MMKTWLSDLVRKIEFCCSTLIGSWSCRLIAGLKLSSIFIFVTLQFSYRPSKIRGGPA